MKINLLFVLSIVILFSCNETEEKTIVQELSWSKIFNEKNLDGWLPKIAGHELGENFGKTFIVEDGILKIRYDAYGDDFDDRFGALFFNKKLSDYRLKIEYRFVGETAPGAPEWGYRDSGIQFHSQSPQSLKVDQAFPVCLEYNLHGGNGTEDRPVGAICANGTFIEINGKKNENYCTPPVLAQTFHGDQWVTMELDVKDGKVSHFVNGKEILSYENPSLNPEHDIAKTFIQNGDSTLNSGYVSLQSNSHPIDFRKIELMEY